MQHPNLLAGGSAREHLVINIETAKNVMQTEPFCVIYESSTGTALLLPKHIDSNDTRYILENILVVFFNIVC